MAVYNIDENLPLVLLSSMSTCFVSFAGLGHGPGLNTASLGLVFGIEGAGLGLGLVAAGQPGLDYWNW